MGRSRTGLKPKIVLKPSVVIRSEETDIEPLVNEENETPFAVNGYYPLYTTSTNARAASPTPNTAREGETTLGYHSHTLNGVEYYMPNGLNEIGQQFHGNYTENGSSSSQTTTTPSSGGSSAYSY